MKTLKKPESIPFGKEMHRRKFLGYVAGSAAIATAVAACNHTDDYHGNLDAITGAINLGSGDIGILNYAYALEQQKSAVQWLQ